MRRNIISTSVCLATMLTATIVGCGDSGGDPKGGGGTAGGGKTGTGGTSAGNSSGGKAQGGMAGGGGTKAGTGGKAEGGESEGGTSAGEGGGAGTGGGEGGGAGEGGAAPVVDCSNLPTKPLMIEELDGPRAYHDIAFDNAGNLIGANGADLLKTALGGKPKAFLPGIGGVEGMDTFANGDLAVIALSEASEISLWRVTQQGGQVLITALDEVSYGVRVGPDGFVYVAGWTSLIRINPQNGEKETVPVNMQWAPRVIDYSPDKKKLYVGAQGGWSDSVGPELVGQEEPVGALVYAFDLDANGAPTGDPKLFAKNIGGGWIDGLSVDACGNLFVAEYQNNNLYRITPTGEVKLFHDWDDTSYGHGLEWGSGIGGFEKTSLYLPQPYDDNTVVRVDVGVPARPR